MPFVNENLIRSMLCDLKEIINVSGEITTWVGTIECKSWRYPSKQGDSVDALSIVQKYTGPSDNCYTQLLELIYDRLHFTINLLVKFLDNLPVLSNHFPLPRNVGRPQNLSLGALLNMYWSRMQLLNENLIPTEQSIADSITRTEASGDTCNNISHDVISRSSQTEMFSLTSCENCNITLELIKRLIVELETSDTSAVAEERKRMKDKLTNVSQWSALKCWVNAILKDFRSLTKAITKAHALRERLTDDLTEKERLFQKKIAKLESNDEHLRKQIGVLEVQVQNLEKNCKQLCETKELLEIKIIDMKSNEDSITKTLEENATSVKQYKSHIEEIESKLEEVISQLQRTDKQHKKTTLECVTWKNKSQQNITEREVAERKFLEMESKMITTIELHKQDLEKIQKSNSAGINKVQDKYNYVKRCLSDEKKSTERLQSECEQLRDNLNIMNSQNAELDSKVLQLETELKKSKDRETLLLEYPDLDCNVRQCKVQGNPIEDMEGQFQSNKIRIKLLEDQNTKLIRTIRKLKHLSEK